MNRFFPASGHRPSSAAFTDLPKHVQIKCAVVEREEHGSSQLARKHIAPVALR
jgi:hypothetical protein